MNIVQALKTVKNDLFDLIVDGLNSKAPVTHTHDEFANINHSHSYNDLPEEANSLLITILRSASYNTDQSENILTLEQFFAGEFDHDHEYTSVVIEPTCTEQGYTIHYCSCGHSYIDSYVDNLGGSHTWGDYNDNIRECSVCGEQDFCGTIIFNVESEGDFDITNCYVSMTPSTTGKWQKFTASNSMRLREMPLDDYHFEVIGDYQKDGYNLTIKYMVEFDGEDPIESQVVTITEEKRYATITFILCYEAIVEE